MTKFDGVEHAKKLWILEQIIETGSFRAAALKAKVSTPAISQALSSLERVVGKPLLIRKDGKLQATDTAQQLMAVTKPAIQALRELTIRMGSSDVPNIAWISFGAYESLAIDLLPKLTERLQVMLPKLKLTVRIASNHSLGAMVRNGELCAAIVEENDNLGRLPFSSCGSGSAPLYVSSRTPESARRWDFPRMVGTISPGPDGYSRYYTKFVQSIFEKGFKPSFVSDSYDALRSSAVHGSVMAILPSRVATRHPGELIEILPPGVSQSSTGAHQILLVSQPNCDQEEIQFLVSEISPLLAPSDEAN